MVKKAGSAHHITDPANGGHSSTAGMFVAQPFPFQGTNTVSILRIRMSIE